jgi:hypothetical protein
LRAQKEQEEALRREVARREADAVTLQKHTRRYASQKERSRLAAERHAYLSCYAAKAYQ